MKKQYMIREAARIVDVRDFRIAYAIDQGYLPEPPRIGNQRIFNDEDIERIRQYFASKSNKGRPAKEANVK